jgi:hypothetical protein
VAKLNKKGSLMVSTTIPKPVLAILLVIALLGSSLGIAHFAKYVPTTGTAQSHSLKGNVNLTPLQDFVQSVENGQRGQVVGIYVPGVLALPVIQQPANNAGFVSRQPNTATQFDLAEDYGTVGILAHNDLAGAQFTGILPDEYAIVVYGDGRLDYYLISEIQKYQALSPTSTFSDFVNLNGSNERLSASDLFTRIYGPGERLVFQTCIEAQGDASWGRMFIIAEPATSQVISMVQQTSFLLEFASFGLAAAR